MKKRRKTAKDDELLSLSLRFHRVFLEKPSNFSSFRVPKLSARTGKIEIGRRKRLRGSHVFVSRLFQRVTVFQFLRLIAKLLDVVLRETKVRRSTRNVRLHFDVFVFVQLFSDVLDQRTEKSFRLRGVAAFLRTKTFVERRNFAFFLTETNIGS